MIFRLIVGLSFVLTQNIAISQIEGNDTILSISDKNMPDTMNFKFSPDQYAIRRASEIDQISDFDSFPMFLFDSCFDYNKVIYWGSLHKPISMRKLIFDYVSNANALRMIIKSNFFNSTCSCNVNKNIKVPFSNKSNYDLAKDRLFFLTKAKL